MIIINKLSVVISVYNEEAVLDKMYQAVVPVVESLPCEYELLLSMMEAKMLLRLY